MTRTRATVRWYRYLRNNHPIIRRRYAFQHAWRWAVHFEPGHDIHRSLI